MPEQDHTDFQYPQFAGEPQEAPEEKQHSEELAKALRTMAEWQTGRAITKRHICPRTVGLRTIACLWVIRPDIFGGCSLNTLSQRVGLGVTDTILSRYATEFRDTFAFKAPAQRSDTTRARMRNASRKQ